MSRHRRAYGRIVLTIRQRDKTLINSDIPDAFDIIHADCESVFGEYKYLVDLSGDSAFAEKHQNAVDAEEAKRLIKEVMPIWVTGGVHWFIGKISDGWYLTVFNNDGIDKSVDGGEVQIKDARRVAVIDIKITPRSPDLRAVGISP